LIKEEMETKVCCLYSFCSVTHIFNLGITHQEELLEKQRGITDDQGEIVELWVAMFFQF